MHSDPADPEIRTLASSVVYTDDWIRVRRDDIERGDGSRGTYAVVERRDFAVVVPAERGGFHLVEEYRYPVGRRSWSFPQGASRTAKPAHKKSSPGWNSPRRPGCAPNG